MTRKTAATITALLSISAAQAQDAPYPSEPPTRTCIQKRLTELVAEKHANIAADTQLTACTSDSKLKAKGKSYCEAISWHGSHFQHGDQQRFLLLPFQSRVSCGLERHIREGREPLTAFATINGRSALAANRSSC